MTRRTDKQIFMDYLIQYLSEYGIETVGNNRFRDYLAWDKKRYDRTKERLSNDGLLVVAPGYGGSIRPIVEEESKLNLFISYSHKDEELKNELLLHLKPLEDLGLIKSWYDNKILPGQDINDEISENIMRSDIILLLISIDFINSNYCYNKEMAKALDRRRNKECEVIPVILRNCLWNHRKMPIGSLKALPRDGKAVCSWTDKDDAFTNIAQKLKEVAHQIIDTRKG